jgi:hypothetical protein
MEQGPVMPDHPEKLEVLSVAAFLRFTDSGPCSNEPVSHDLVPA